MASLVLETLKEIIVVAIHLIVMIGQKRVAVLVIDRGDSVVIQVVDMIAIEIGLGVVV